MITLADVLAKMEQDLAWRGPGGKPMGHIVLTREEAAYLHEHVIALIVERDKLVRDLDTAAEVYNKLIRQIAAAGSGVTP